MRNNNLFITPIFIFITILSIVSLLFITIIDYFIYDRVLNSNLYLVYCFIIIISYLLRKMKIYKFVPIILVIGVTSLFWINRPNFTYKQAVEIIKNEKKIEYIHKGITNIKMVDAPNVYINKAYIINMKKNGQVIKYVFDPIDGKYSILD